MDHDPKRNALTVVTSDAVMLELASVSAAEFDLEATFSQTPWTGGIGLYFQGREEEPQGQDRLFAEVVVLWRIEGPITNPASLTYGVIRRSVAPPDRAIFSPVPRAAQITRPTGQPQRLSLTVGKTGLTSVRWNDTALPEIIKAASSTKRAGASGIVGIWGQNSTTQFSSVRVRPRLLPGDSK